MDRTALFAEPEAVASADDCYFYHVMEIPGHGLVGGEWDLRAGVDDYLGGVDLSAQRVLEIGPASGFLTFHMETTGAAVVSIELAPDSEWDFVPLSSVDMSAVRVQRLEQMRRLRNGYWFAHEHFASKARCPLRECVRATRGPRTIRHGGARKRSAAPSRSAGSTRGVRSHLRPAGRHRDARFHARGPGGAAAAEPG